MPNFCSFSSFDYAFQWFRKPLTIIFKLNNRNSRNALGDPIKGTTSKRVNEPIIATNNPNLTFSNVNGGQQSSIIKVWESKAIKDAPRGTIVKTSKHKFIVDSSTHITGTELWYYQLKEVGDHA